MIPGSFAPEKVGGARREERPEAYNGGRCERRGVGAAKKGVLLLNPIRELCLREPNDDDAQTRVDEDLRDCDGIERQPRVVALIPREPMRLVAIFGPALQKLRSVLLQFGGVVLQALLHRFEAGHTSTDHRVGCCSLRLDQFLRNSVQIRAIENAPSCGFRRIDVKRDLCIPL